MMPNKKKEHYTDHYPHTENKSATSVETKIAIDHKAELKQEIQRERTNKAYEQDTHLAQTENELADIKKQLEEGKIDKTQAKKLHDEILAQHNSYPNIGTISNNTLDSAPQQSTLRSKATKGLLRIGAGIGAWFGVKKLQELWKKDKKEEQTSDEKDNKKTDDQEKNKENDKDKDSKKESDKDEKEEKKDTNSNKDNNSKKADEKEGRWSRHWGKVVGGIAGLAGLGGLGYYFKDKLYKVPVIGNWLDRVFNKRLTMDEAMGLVKGEIFSRASEDHFKSDHAEPQWNESKKELTIFNKSFDIDTENRKIKGLDIRFPTYEEMIKTAYVIAAAHYHFQGKCKTTDPFAITALGGDIEVALDEGAEDFASGTGVRIGTLSGGIIGGLITGGATAYVTKNPLATAGATAAGTAAGAYGGHLVDTDNTLAELLPTIDDDHNKKKLVSYLNKMKGWHRGSVINVKERAQTDETAINTIFTETLHKIQNTIDMSDEQRKELGIERNPSITNHPQYQNVLCLSARGVKSYLEVKKDPSGTITSVSFEDSGITFTGSDAISQALHTALFVNRMEKIYTGKGNNHSPFEWRDSLVTKSLGRLGGDSNLKGIFIDQDSKWDPNTWAYSRVLSAESLEKNIPLLYHDASKRDQFINWLNQRQNTNGSSLWHEDNGTGSVRKNTFLQAKESAISTTSQKTQPQHQQASNTTSNGNNKKPKH